MPRVVGPSPEEIARRERRLRAELTELIEQLLASPTLPADRAGAMVAAVERTLAHGLHRLHTDPIPEMNDSDAYYREWAARNVRPEPPGPKGAESAGPPQYADWADFIRRTTTAERMAWCRMKAKKFNRTIPEGVRLTPEIVWSVMRSAKGRCRFCGSLAVERRPSKASGAPAPWESVGRRIGSLEHIRPRVYGGSNARRNLAWCCLWCNTWPGSREPGATDHGGHYPPA